MILFVVPKDPDVSEPKKSLLTKIADIDLAGFALFAGSIVMLLLALQFGGSTYKWGSSQIIGLFVGWGVTMIVFVVWQWKRQDRALIPPSVMKQRTVLSSFLVALFGNGAFQVLVYFLPVWFQATKGVDALHSGIRYLPTAIADLVTAVIGGVLS